MEDKNRISVDINSSVYERSQLDIQIHNLEHELSLVDYEYEPVELDDLEEISKRISALEVERSRLEPVNMRAIEAYEEQEERFNEYKERRDKVMEELDRTFQPEFLNHVDEIILFRGLTKDDLVHIVDIQMRHLRELLTERNVALDLTDAARQYLAETSFDPVYGARPLKRVIQREVQDALALALLRGEFGEGDTVQVDARDGEIAFGKT